MTGESDLAAAGGFIEPRVRDEFPGLSLSWVSVEARPRGTTREVKHRLRELSNRYHGASVVAMRTQPIPHAYRAFFRQVGLDPDATRVPSEEAAVGRLLQGGFRSTDLLSDALLIALVETGIPVWALDADHVEPGGLGIRTTRQGDSLGPVEALAPGRLAVADAQAIHALLFGPIAPGREVGPRTSRIMLFAVAVAGVPAIHVEEALWIAGEVLTVG